ncbi:MAG: class I SAM-dependent methyltransferase [Bryobacteraceae bacterium]
METQTEPLQVLLDLYASRADLQEAYPEVSDKELQPLINWAANASKGVLQDSHRDILEPHTAWYAEHASEFKPPILWEAIEETCSLAENAGAISTAVNSKQSEDDDIGEHLPILCMLVREFELKQIVELGTRTGNSSLTLLAAAKSVGGRVLSMDIQPCELAQQRVASAGLADSWSFRHTDDLRVPDSDIPQPIDLLFIDTWHTYNQLTAELKKYTPHLRSGSWIAIHDYVSFPGMTRAVRDWIASQPQRFRFYPFANQNGLALIRV